MSDKGYHKSYKGYNMSDKGYHKSDKGYQLSDKGYQMSDKGYHLSDKGYQMSDKSSPFLFISLFTVTYKGSFFLFSPPLSLIHLQMMLCAVFFLFLFGRFHHIRILFSGLEGTLYL